VARKYIRPEAANIVVVGNSDEVAKKLEQFGPVSMYDNYGRSMAPSSRKAAPANVSAEDIRRKYVAAVGGEKAIAGIKDIKIVYGAEIQGTKITYTEAKSNGRLKKEVAAGEMVFQKSVYADGKGKMEMQGQSKDLSGEELAESKRDADIQAVLHPEQYGMKRTVVGMEKLNGEDHYVVETVDASGSKGKEYYQVSTGLLIRQADLMKTPQGEMPRIIEFSDYREVPGTGGYKIPYTIRQGTAAQELEFNVQSVDVNKGIPDSEFKF
jgi:hypothetical protein